MTNPAVLGVSDDRLPGTTAPGRRRQQQLRRFETILRFDPDLMQLLASIRSVRLPQWRLVAGCLYQTVWNVLTGRVRGTGIKDYDLIYFDDDDLSDAGQFSGICRNADRVLDADWTPPSLKRDQEPRNLR